MTATTVNLDRVVDAVFKSSVSSRPFVNGGYQLEKVSVGQGVARIGAVQQSIEYRRIISSMPA